MGIYHKSLSDEELHNIIKANKRIIGESKQTILEVEKELERRKILTPERFKNMLFTVIPANLSTATTNEEYEKLYNAYQELLKEKENSTDGY